MNSKKTEALEAINERIRIAESLIKDIENGLIEGCIECREKDLLEFKLYKSIIEYSIEEDEGKETFKPGEPFLYKNGTSYEIGIVKRLCEKHDPNDEQDYFCYYHTGDTAERTMTRSMHKIRNAYAFDITRLSCE